ncbi:TPA: MobV family relaxase, partial [Haemophilus influenzae]
MSKLVCNFDKYKGVQLYGMDIHIQRKTDNHSNKDIDLSRKHLNYELVAEHQNEHYYTRAKNRIEQGYTGKRKIRKDGVWTGNVIISSDQEFFKKLTPEQEREFFKTAYDFYCEKYGKENVISAMVHKDETTPHLHLLIVPLTKDGRLCAKELFDREALRSFHDIIAKRLQQRGFNIERGERNAKVKRIETDEYKRLKKDNQVTVKINPNDTVATVLEKKLIGADVKETPEQIANRLTQKYVKPLTDELTDLRTEKALSEKRNDAIKYAKAFSQSRENEFIALYHS